MRFRTQDIMPPPIVKLIDAARRYTSSPGFLNLGQGLPGHVPPERALVALRDRLSHPATHVYSPDEGMLELREELAIYLRRTSKIDVNPQDELVITAGANNAFAGAMMALLHQGQKVVMPTPYYFNSVMAVEMLGGQVVEVAGLKGFQPDPATIESAMDDDTCAVFLITPNNPTGAVYERNTVDRIVDVCIERDIPLISDETYASMIFDDATHYSPRSRRDAIDHVITLGSFSKDFGMSGWRIGYVIGPEEFIQEYLKVQDTITICAPTAGQLLALEVLKSGLDFIEDELRRLGLLRELAYLRASEIDALELERTKGTFYMFPHVKGCEDSKRLVLDILQSTEMLVLPGSIFGASGEGHIRLSFGPLTPEAVDEAFDRLAGFFKEN